MTRLDDASPQVTFTPPECLHGRSVDVNRLPPSCDNTWSVVIGCLVRSPAYLQMPRFVLPGDHNDTAHATRSSSSRAVLRFQGMST